MRDSLPQRQLWQAVLWRVLLDIRDAGHGARGQSDFVSACRWVGNHPSREFCEVCSLAGFEPDFIHPRFVQLIATANAERDKARVSNALAAE